MFNYMTTQTCVLTYRGEERKVDINDSTLGEQLFKVAKEMTHLKETRIRIEYFDEEKKKKIPISNETKISTLSIHSFIIKDLGPQVNYRAVFYLEYIGPFLIFPIVLFFSGIDISTNIYLKMSFIMWMFHYTKRLLETMFVHTFSHGTMPLRNLIKNCTYYHGFAFMISYSIINKSKTVTSIDTLSYVFCACFFICEMLNFYCHIKLRLLRPSGSTGHFLPKGFMFNSIISPNYTAEIAGWIFYSLFTKTPFSFLFSIVGACQMYIWAKKKKRSLSEEFPEAKKRGTITPFF